MGVGAGGSVDVDVGTVLGHVGGVVEEQPTFPVDDLAPIHRRQRLHRQHLVRGPSATTVPLTRMT